MVYPKLIDLKTTGQFSIQVIPNILFKTEENCVYSLFSNPICI